MLINDLLRRSLVLFCAGTAMLLVLAQWRTAATTTSSIGLLPPPPPRPFVMPTLVGKHLRVDLGDRRLYVYRDNLLLAAYPVAVGKQGWETPIGVYQVTEKQKYPVWRHPITNEIVPQGGDNPLGSRWIGFWNDGRHLIGFHGTPDANLVGQPISHGCLRMEDSHIQALYEQVSLGTPVIVEE